MHKSSPRAARCGLVCVVVLTNAAWQTITFTGECRAERSRVIPRTDQTALPLPARFATYGADSRSVIVTAESHAPAGQSAPALRHGEPLSPDAATCFAPLGDWFAAVDQSPAFPADLVRGEQSLHEEGATARVLRDLQSTLVGDVSRDGVLDVEDYQQQVLPDTWQRGDTSQETLVSQ